MVVSVDFACPLGAAKASFAPIPFLLINRFFYSLEINLIKLTVHCRNTGGDMFGQVFICKLIDLV